MLDDIPKPVKILDIGGTENYWIQMGAAGNQDYYITVLNPQPIKTTYDNITFNAGDARDLSRFKTDEFHVIFSNSVIEHVGSFVDQKKMAEEIIKHCTKFYVQTPNYYFPMEPHFLFPFFQFLPMKMKVFLVRNFRLGWFQKQKSVVEAERLISSIRLLKQNELAALFPGAKIQKEKLFFLTKSFIVTKQ